MHLLGYPYEWENGKTTDYTNWAPGEPNDVDGSQNCVRMYAISGEWDDYYCYESYNLGYVCQVRQDLYQKGKALTPAHDRLISIPKLASFRWASFKKGGGAILHAL